MSFLHKIFFITNFSIFHSEIINNILIVNYLL